MTDVQEEAEKDVLFEQLRSEALQAEEREPAMSLLLRRTVLSEHATSFESAVAYSIAHRLGKSLGVFPDVCPLALANMFRDELASNSILEGSHTASVGIRQDAVAYQSRDPACETLLECILFFKGYAATVTHRVAYRKWHSQSSRQRFMALWLQSQASQVFGVDIHPAAQIGAGVMMDHATGIVIGECAVVGDGCTLLHGVTLGGTGKNQGDRHPKIGANVLIGANVSVLGNISIGAGAKIGAGSVVLRPVPHGATAVGSPARIIGFAKESKPAETMDMQLDNVIQFDKSGAVSGEDDDDDDDTTTSDSQMTPDMMETDQSASTASLNTLSTTTSTTDVQKLLPALASLALKGDGQRQRQSEPTGDTKETKEQLSQAHHKHHPRRHSYDASDPHIPVVTNRRGPSKRQSQGDTQALSSLSPSSHKKKHAHNSTSPSSDPYCVFRHFKHMKNTPPTAYTYCKLRKLLLQEKATDAEIGDVFMSLLQQSPHPETGYIPAATFDRYFITNAAKHMPSVDPLRLQTLVIVAKERFNRRQTVIASGGSGGNRNNGGGTSSVATAQLQVIKWAEEEKEQQHSPAPEVAVASSS